MTAPDPSTELMQMINCYQVSQALHVAATLGVADQLKEGRSLTMSWREHVVRILRRSIDCSGHWPPLVYFTRQATKNFRSLHWAPV